MPRRRRVSAGGYAYHVLNRANRRARIFRSDDDYAAFERLLFAAVRRSGIRLCAYCVMPNHWHLVLWPSDDGQLPECLQWLTQTHTQRWNAHRALRGTGHLYQGRYKSFLIQQDSHFLSVCQYVESNPVRAALSDSAATWRWGSAGLRAARPDEWRGVLAEWPTGSPPEWEQRATVSPGPAVISRIESCVRRDRPFGDAEWVEGIVAEFGLTSTVQPQGRPPRRRAS